MIDLIRAASDLQSFLLLKGWKFCFIGGIAVQQWGEPRLTRDIDVTILTGFGAEENFVKELLSKYSARIDHAVEFALANRVLLLHIHNDIGIDISLGGLPFEESIIYRAKDIEILPDIKLRICSPEDLIILKCFASRAIDWHDVQTIIIRQDKKNLDWNYIELHLRPLVELKGQPEILEKLLKLKNLHDPGLT